MFVGVQLHLPGDPGAVKVRVPPALLLVLGVFVLVTRPDEGDAEVALLPVHGHLVLPGRDGRGRVLLGCWVDGEKIRQVPWPIAPRQESVTTGTSSLVTG